MLFSNGPYKICKVHFAKNALLRCSLSTMDTSLEKDYLPPFPGLTLKSFRNNLPHSEATTMGHLDNIRKNTRSTKKAPKKQPWPPADPYDFPPQPENTTRTHTCFLAVTETKNCVYTDQVGRLPQPSSKGNNYILIAYDYDSNCIFMRPLRNRKAETLTSAVANIHATLSKGGCKPKFHCLECPQLLKDYCVRKGIEYKLVPPNDHRANAAERGVRTSKNHLAATWAGADDHFPMHLWDKTLPQAEMTVNFLRGSRSRIKNALMNMQIQLVNTF
jgi:hypothetical protein